MNGQHKERIDGYLNARVKTGWRPGSPGAGFIQTPFFSGDHPKLHSIQPGYQDTVEIHLWGKASALMRIDAPFLKI